MNETKETFREINESYTIKEAIDEAKRCLNCKNPSCKKRVSYRKRHSRLYPSTLYGKHG